MNCQCFGKPAQAASNACFLSEHFRRDSFSWTVCISHPLKSSGHWLASLSALFPSYNPSGNGILIGRHVRELSAVNGKLFYNETLMSVDSSKFLPFWVWMNGGKMEVSVVSLKRFVGSPDATVWRLVCSSPIFPLGRIFVGFLLK